jgi:hypothetical protein
MNLNDKAEQGNKREVRLARDSMGLYKLQSEELTGADQVTDEDEFPQYGDFLDCMTTTGGADPSFNVEVWVECPSQLAQQLVDLEIDVGDVFRIKSTYKDEAGEWTYTVEESDTP